MMRYASSEAKSWVRQNLHGHIAVTTTPFLENGDIDEDGLRRNVDHILALPGVNGLYLSSIYQEFWTMTTDERKRVAEIVIASTAGRVPVIVGTSHTSVRDVLDLAKHAQAAGADLIMVWPPYYGPRTEDGMYAFYEYVSERVDIGICVYSTTLAELGYFLTPELVARLAEIDNICAVKEASLNLDGYSAMIERVGHLLPVSCPLEEYHLYGLITFGPKIMPHFLLGSSRPLYMQNKEHPYCAQFFQAAEHGDFDAAREFLRSILNISQRLHSRFLTKGGHNVALTKYITGLFGMAAGPVRPPLSAPPKEEIAEAIAVLTDANLLPKVAALS
jgi:4-hydroxy-tetrahydrodipicolinate synthase